MFLCVSSLFTFFFCISVLFVLAYLFCLYFCDFGVSDCMQTFRDTVFQLEIEFVGGRPIFINILVRKFQAEPHFDLNM